jgi:hypothetical protein
MSYQVKNNKVVLEDGRELTFDYSIGQTLDYGGEVFLVRLDVPRGTWYNKNVFGVDPREGIRWQLPDTFGREKSVPVGGMHREGELVILGTWTGWWMSVDPKTGQIMEKQHQLR